MGYDDDKINERGFDINNYHEIQSVLADPYLDLSDEKRARLGRLYSSLETAKRRADEYDKMRKNDSDPDSTAHLVLPFGSLLIGVLIGPIISFCPLILIGIIVGLIGGDNLKEIETKLASQPMEPIITCLFWFFALSVLYWIGRVASWCYNLFKPFDDIVRDIK